MAVFEINVFFLKRKSKTKYYLVYVFKVFWNIVFMFSCKKNIKIYINSCLLHEILFNEVKCLVDGDVKLVLKKKVRSLLKYY